MDKFTLGLVQHSCSPVVEENIQKAIDGINEACRCGANVVMTQELFRTSYFCQTEDVRYFDAAETIPGPSTDIFAPLARKNNAVLVLSLFERRAPGLFHNTAVVLETDGSIAGVYRKMHIPDDPQFYEKFYFTPGDLGFHPIRTSIAKLGVMVCWDQWYPEAARLMALRGADVLLYPTAIGWTMEDTNDERKRQFDAWLTIQKSHAVANGIPVAAANRSGLEHPNEMFEEIRPTERKRSRKGLNFWGNSFICGSQGEILARGPNSGDDVVVAEIDNRRTDDVRRIWPFLRDRRIDDYQGLDKRWLSDGETAK
jgi:N-carbamoylputrescine amidase